MADGIVFETGHCMKSHDDIYHLIARKLSGEASASELTQLNNLLEHNPLLTEKVDMITELWNQGEYASEKEVVRAYEKLWQKVIGPEKIISSSIKA